MLGLGHRIKEIVIHGNLMTGMFILRNLSNVGPLIAIYSLLVPRNLETLLTSLILENTTSLGKTKSLCVRKAAYFYRILKK